MGKEGEAGQGLVGKSWAEPGLVGLAEAGTTAELRTTCRSWGGRSLPVKTLQPPYSGGEEQCLLTFIAVKF